MSSVSRFVATLAALFASTGVALAQEGNGTPQTVAGIVDFLVTNQAVQTGDFERDREAAEAARDAISRADAGVGVVVVTDLYGATPSRCAQELAHEHDIASPVVVLCGLSMPMLVKLASASRETTPAELARTAAETARRSVRLADDGGT